MELGVIKAAHLFGAKPLTGVLTGKRIPDVAALSGFTLDRMARV